MRPGAAVPLKTAELNPGNIYARVLKRLYLCRREDKYLSWYPRLNPGRRTVNLDNIIRERKVQGGAWLVRIPGEERLGQALRSDIGTATVRWVSQAGQDANPFRAESSDLGTMRRLVAYVASAQITSNGVAATHYHWSVESRVSGSWGDCTSIPHRGADECVEPDAWKSIFSK